MHIPQPCPQRVHRHPSNDIYCPTGRIYPIPIYKFKWHIFPNCLQYLSNQMYNLEKPAPENCSDTPQLMYILQLLPEYIQYQYIHSTDIYSPIVGSIQPILPILQNSPKSPESPDYQIHPICQIHQKINIYKNHQFHQIHQNQQFCHINQN